MVLVDFTVVERWRVFGELSLSRLVTVQRKASAKVAVAASTATARGERLPATVDPRESAVRRELEAACMQRML